MSDDLNPEVRISVIADTERGQQSVAAIQRLVAAARAEVEKFAQAGGLGRLAKDAGILDITNDLIDETAATLQSATRRADTLSQAIAAVGTESSQFDRLNDRLQDTQSEIIEAVEYLQQIPLALQDGAAQAELLNKSLQATSETAGVVGSTGTTPRGSAPRAISGADRIGQFERPLIGLTGAASFFGLDQSSIAAQSLRGVSEVTGSIEAIGRLRESVTELKPGSLASAAAMGALGVAIVALGPLVSVLRDKANDATGPFRDLADSFDRERELLEYRKQISGQTQEQIAAEIRSQEDLIALYEQQVSKSEAAIAGSKEVGDKLIGDVGIISDALTGALDLAGYDADVLESKLPELQKNLETARQKLEALNSPLIQLAIAADADREVFFQQLDFEQKRRELIENGTKEQLEAGRRALEGANRDIDETLPNFANDVALEIQQAFLDAGYTGNIFDQKFQELGGKDNKSTVEQAQIAAQVAQIYGVEIPTAVQDNLDIINQKLTEQKRNNEELKQVYNDQAVITATSQRTVNELIPTLRDFFDVMFDGQTAEEERQAAIVATTSATEEAAEAETKRAQALLDDAAKTSQSIQQLEAARAQQLEKQRQADAEAAVIAGFRSQIEAAKEAEAVQARNNKVVALQQEAHTSELEALQKHEAAKAKTQADFDLQQRRREEDLAEDLRQAEEDRDVKSYLRIERQGEKELNRAKEDNDLRSKEQETALREQIREIRQNANERIRVERESGQRRLIQSQLLEKQLADYQNNRARQHQNDQRQIEAQGYQERITQLRTHMQQLTQELLNGLVIPLRGGLGVLGNTITPLPVGAGAAIGGLRTGGAGIAVTVAIGQQNIGRFAQAEDIARVERQNRQIAQTVVTAVQRSRTNTGAR
ncbi:MAG: hypothetical protein DPW16_22060 [Chloroflexi bacterium]|nr:hypothetical protein [Chloroflexota bacterium]